MPRQRAETIQVKFSFVREIYDIIKEDSASNGVSMSAYLSMLAKQKRIQDQAIQFVAKLTPEQIKQAGLPVGKEDSIT